MSFAARIPGRARAELEAEAAEAGRSLEEHLEIKSGQRPPVAAADRQGRGLKARVVDVFNVLDQAGDTGATDLEIAAKLDGLDEFAVEICRRELVAGGLVEDTGRRLRTTFGDAVVWALTVKGREVLR